MFNITIAIAPHLEKRIRAAVARKAELLKQIQDGDLSESLLTEIATLDMQLSQFGENIFRMAEAMNTRMAEAMNTNRDPESVPSTESIH